MKLTDLVIDLDTIDEELIIFKTDLNDYDSDIFLLSDENENLIVTDENGKSFHYLIELFLAKEFIEDWIKSLNYLPEPIEIAQRLHRYAINDA